MSHEYVTSCVWVGGWGGGEGAAHRHRQKDKAPTTAGHWGTAHHCYLGGGDNDRGCPGGGVSQVVCMQEGGAADSDKRVRCTLWLAMGVPQSQLPGRGGGEWICKVGGLGKVAICDGG